MNTDARLEMPPLSGLLTEEGPESHGEQVVNVLLDEAATRWPHLAPAALSLGFRSLHAFPFRRREHVLGAVTILTTETTPLADADIRIGTALADAATIGMLNHRAIAGLTATSEQLQGALSSRVIIEQAKGLVSARLEIGLDEAFLLMRRYARGHNQRISEVAGQLVSRDLTAAALAASLQAHVMKTGRRR
ncbi:ANTAR domain-containing protein [Amycolatopsis sp. lyj-112]|uniref:ANTAR domain-containing protein n=1 Tax=Amycolatopsis sp. lyj-112 TaxID=2789288 RepID=UPI00397A98DF